MSARRNAAQTRQRILAAARTEFSAHGMAGARVDRIAAEAGVNKRMLYHYFQNKDGLYRATLDAGLTAIRFNDADLAERLALLAEHPDTLRLWAWQMLDGAIDEAAAPNRLAALWQDSDVAPESREAIALLGAAIVPVLLSSGSMSESAAADREARSKLLARLVAALSPSKPRIRYRWREP